MSLGFRKDLSCEKVRPSENLVFRCILLCFRKVKEFEKRADVFENLSKINLEASPKGYHFRMLFLYISKVNFRLFWGPFGVYNLSREVSSHQFFVEMIPEGFWEPSRRLLEVS